MFFMNGTRTKNSLFVCRSICSVLLMEEAYEPQIHVNKSECDTIAFTSKHCHEAAACWV